MVNTLKPIRTRSENEAARSNSLHRRRQLSKPMRRQFPKRGSLPWVTLTGCTRHDLQQMDAPLRKLLVSFLDNFCMSGN